MTERANKTPQDAFERVVYAKMGCFVDSTDLYLECLRAELYKWIESVNNELGRRADLEEARQYESDMDQSEEDYPDDYDRCPDSGREDFHSDG